MKIESMKTVNVGSPLNSFKPGDCIRLVDDGRHDMFLGCVYIVGCSNEPRRLAISLTDGTYRCNGRFVLEPNAKVVIE